MLGSSPSADRFRGVVLSVIIPAYNAAATLARTLRSFSRVAAADRPRIQLIVVNDGSTDSTAAIISEHERTLPEFAWTVLAQANRGVAAARNAGLDSVLGEWILLLDADDELSASPLATLMDSDDFSCVVFPTRYYRGDIPSKVVPARVNPRCSFLDIFTAGNPYPICSIVFRATHLDSRFDPNLRYLEDWKFWWDNPRVFSRMRAAEDEPLAAVHIHGQNRTSHFAQTAIYRERVAAALLASSPERLNRCQRNNLRLHLAIARVGKGRAHALFGLLAVPCDPTLYLKFLAYFLLREQIRRLDPYG